MWSRFLRPFRDAAIGQFQELAEFYRVEEALVRTGLGIETDRGISDEGDPWFIFCHGDSGDIVVHFARFDGCYVVASPAFDQCMYGENFRTLIDLIDSHPVILSNSKAVGKNIYSSGRFACCSGHDVLFQAHSLSSVRW